ncbi:MAG TPA: hypothetical protein VI094_05365 [Propionibacteriaceae bacterium]
MSELEPPTVDVRTPASPTSRQPDHRHPAIDAALLESLAAAVLATHGVLRLEPTLQGSLRRLMTATKQQLPGPGRPSATVAGSDKITVTYRPGPTGRAETQLSVDIATSTLAPARQIARTVRQSIVDCLRLNGHQPGLIHVNVLSIEPSPAQPSSL